MTEFLFLFRGSQQQLRSPEQMQRSYEKWRAWFSDLQQRGVLKNPTPLEHVGKLVRGRSKDVHDGPYAEVKDLVNGYALIEAATIDDAVNLSKGCPIFEDDGSVEVRPIAKL
jgi:hypothetical protein